MSKNLLQQNVGIHNSTYFTRQSHKPLKMEISQIGYDLRGFDTCSPMQKPESVCDQALYYKVHLKAEMRVDVQRKLYGGC